MLPASRRTRNAWVVLADVEGRGGREVGEGRGGSVHTPETVITATVFVWKAVSQSEEPRSMIAWSSVMLVVV